MADGFEITPATLTTASSALQDVEADLREKISGVMSTVTDGNPWGGDEQGSIFGALYTAVVSHAIETVSSHADQLDYAAVSLHDWADTHQQNDTAVQARFQALAP